MTTMQILLPLLTITATLFQHTVSQSVSCANPADIMFLLDGSDSIDAQEWNQERNFVARMINTLDISPSTINVGFTVYSSNVDRHLGLTPFRPKIVLNAMAKMLEHPTGIATNTAKGIAKVRETFRNQPSSRSNAPKIMIVITDGSSENPAETIRQAQLAKADGIRIIAVGVGNNVFLEELQEIATNQQKFYQTPDFAALRGIESDIRNMICRVITTTQSPRFTLVPPTAPPDVIPVDGDKICNNPGDIVFVVDGSDSISDADFVRLKNFVANLIDNFEIGPDAIHVGIIVYSTLVGEKIGLFPPKNKLILKALANNLEHPKFGTDTASGIEAARNMLSQQGRPNAPEIIVVITDGRSTNPRNTIVQASIAKAQGITMISIGVGKDIFSEELNQMATSPNYVSEVADFAGLANTVNVMRNLICTSITTTPISTTTMMAPTAPPSVEPPPPELICNVPGDVIFVLDGSDSIKPNDWIRQRNFVANLINHLEVGQPYIHVSVLVYSSTIGEVVPLMPFKPKPILKMLVSNLTQPRFGTDTALGIQKARTIIKDQGRNDAPKVVIVVTDGKSTFPDNTMIQANMAKADGVTMISVGVGTDVFVDELRDIASSDSQVFTVIDFASLSSIIAALRNKICQVVQTTTTPKPTTPAPTTTTTEMTTPLSVPLYPCVESRTEADLVFLLDGHKSMSPYNWMMETNFVANFLDGFEIQPEFVHIGAVVSDHIRGDEIGVSPFKHKMHMKEMIHGLMQPSGDMDTASGLRKVQDIFNLQSRRNAEKIMVFLTDGSSRSMAETNRETQKIKDLGVDVVTIGVGDKVNLAELTTMATNPALTLRSRNVNQMFGLLQRLQNIVCELLKKPETTTMAVTTPMPMPALCEGCLIDAGVGFNPYPGDCTKFVQCWKQGDTINAYIRSCPFGQFWDADAITCRPSFLVRCTADPCKTAQTGFTYGMGQYGCRAYWKCIDSFSVGHCCPMGSAYVEGMGCLESTTCREECPPIGGIAVKPVCDMKAHWDKRYYIEIIYGRGEIVRPCPAGTIFFEEKCSCDFGLSGLLPTTPDVLCQPSAFFPFDKNLNDQSLNRINVGNTNVKLTDLGTAFFNGFSETNLWRFAGTDWGNKLVIKFKFRFDYSNKFIDYGGLPVDLGIDFDANMNLISDYHMTDMDWRLWNHLRKVRTLQDWRQLLKEFGQSRTFYIFLGTLGFKPGTSNSLQVVRILGTPAVYQTFQTLLNRMRENPTADMNAQGNAGLKGILTRLRAMRGLINWDSIIKQLRGDTGSSSGSSTGSGTTIADGTRDEIPRGTGEWRWDGISGQWIKVSSSTGGGLGLNNTENILNIGGADAASEWSWNRATGQWERLATTDVGTGSTQTDIQITNEFTGQITGGQSGGQTAGGAFAGMAGASGGMGGFTGGMGGASGGMASASGGMGGFTGGMGGASSGMAGASGGMGGFTGGMGGASGGMAGASGGMSGFTGGMGGASGGMGATSGGMGGFTGGMGGISGGMGAASGNMGGASGGMGGFSGSVGGTFNGMSVSSGGMGTASGNMGGVSGGMASASGGGVGGGSFSGQTEGSVNSWRWEAEGSTTPIRQGGSASGQFAGVGGAQTGGTGIAGIKWEDIMRELAKMQNTTSGTWQWRSVGDTQGGNVDANQKAIEALLAQLKLGDGKTGSAQWEWNTSGDTAASKKLDIGTLNSILKQMQEMAKSSDTGVFNTSGTFVTSGGQSAVFTGGMGSNNGGSTPNVVGGSKRTIQVRTESEQPIRSETIKGGRVVGGNFMGSASNSGVPTNSLSGGGQFKTGMNTVLETSVRRQGKNGDVKMTSQQTNGPSSSGTVVSMVKQTVQSEGGAAIPDRSAPRGAAARGVKKERQDGSFIGLTVPGTEFVSRSTVMGQGNRGNQVTPQNQQFQINEILQEVSPMAFEATGNFVADGKSGSSGWSSLSGGSFGASAGAAGAASGAAGGSGQFVGRQVVSGGSVSGGASGDFTHMGKVVGSGGGVKRVIDTNMKRLPAGAVEFNADGGVSLASLGLGGAEGANIIRQTVRVEPVSGSSEFSLSGGGQFSESASGGQTFGSASGAAGGQAFGSASGGAGGQGFMSMNSLGGGASGGSFSASGSSSSSGSGGVGGMGMNTLNSNLGQGSFTANLHSSGSMLPFMMGDAADTFLDGFGGKKRRRRSAGKSRAKRSVNKQNYQALVTNCQGQDGQGPSIMVVANQGDVQFALKTYGHDPAVISVPAVDGWNDVTLIYDGRSLTGVVENWKGAHKASVNLQGNIERRQAGLLTGSCQGFASFHGEIDDLSVFKCLTPAMEELRDRIILHKK